MSPEQDVEAIERRVAELRAGCDRLRAALQARLIGQDGVVEELLLALLAGGHALIEGAPGLGKTTLVRALAAALDLSFQRVQCTPDLMPADVLGTRVLEEDGRGGRRFRFEKGPVFTHVLLADEVNRATPRTQAALLEAMAERQVTIFGETLPLEEPFFVAATQNPIEMEGTFPLPEAQLDRFLLHVTVLAPRLAELQRILEETTGPEAGSVERVLSRAELLELRALVREVPASQDTVARVARLVRATHPDDALAGTAVRAHVRWGASPRGGQALLLAAKARALLQGRLHVAPSDLERLAGPALRHRLVLSWEGEGAGVSREELVREAWARSA